MSPSAGEPSSVCADLGPREAAPETYLTRESQLWLQLALGSLLLAGLLSLTVVVGRIPAISAALADPLFFKRCLVVHVNLALVVWFYSVVSALAAAGPVRGGRTLSRTCAWAAFAGVAIFALAACERGGVPILSNYVPVIQTPVFLVGLGLFFAAVLVHSLGVLISAAPRSLCLPGETTTGVTAACLLLVVAFTAWLLTQVSLPTGLLAHTYFEFSFWGPGHVLQVANAAAMTAIWLWIVRVATGKGAVSHGAAQVAFGLLVLPQLAVPVSCGLGVMSRVHLEGMTTLMRWTIFPVVSFLGLVCLLRIRQYPKSEYDLRGRSLIRGFTVSVALTALGFILGALIRGSSTLVPAHYHASLGGVTAAFMTATYLLTGRTAERLYSEGTFWRRAGSQLLVFGGGQAVFAIGFALAGLYGLGRKTYGAEQVVRSLGEKVGLGVMGVGGLVAATGGIWFLVLVLRPAFRRITPLQSHSAS
ncbi:hypothetical protein [Nibricoccus sp. IMCC34717]|uniref:hypothetical protein n=1 Tax=Nibricoccus sp. IMCC34717 TaxID=3034021 RepID=UPI00384B074C